MKSLHKANNTLFIILFRAVSMALLIIVISYKEMKAQLAMDTVQFDNCNQLVPKNTVIPITYTKEFPNTEVFSPLMPGGHAFYTFKDHEYNKTYITGARIQILDYNNLTNGNPTSTIKQDMAWPHIDRLEEAVSDYTDKIYFSTLGHGLYSIDRATGISESYDLIAEDSLLNYQSVGTRSVWVDNVNDLLYTAVFYQPTASFWPRIFYGLLELNLRTNVKRWIKIDSAAVSIPQVFDRNDPIVWNIHNLYLDNSENRLYFSTGYGVWWWDRDDDTTGVFDDAGGIPLNLGEAQLPHNWVTNFFIDSVENKFYFGTHEAGLYVWDRSNGTSEIFNAENSELGHNLVNFIDKDYGRNIIYAGLELGGIWEYNIITKKQKLYTSEKGVLSEPQLISNYVSSASYDEVDDRLYTSTWADGGGIWVRNFQDSVQRAPLLISKDTAICAGNSVQLSSSGLFDHELVWSDGNGFGNRIVSPDTTTTYSYTITDESGCTATGDITVSVGNSFELTPILSVPICLGDSTTLAVEELTGASYLWEPGGYITSSINVLPDVTSRYQVTATSPTGCTSQTVILPQFKTLATASPDITICSIDSTSLTVTDGDSYLWSTGETTQDITFSSATPGVFTLSVQVTSGGCVSTDEVVVTVEEYCPSPVNFTARALSESEIELSWLEPMGNHTTYIIQKRDDQGNYVTVATLPIGTISWLDENLEPSTTYYYKVYTEVASSKSGDRYGNARTFTPNQNFIAETIVISKDNRDPDLISDLPNTERRTTWRYLNGLGTEIQVVVEGASPSESDIIQPMVFDAAGLTRKNYLSYTKSQPEESGNYSGNAETEVLAYYANPPEAVAQTNFPYSYSRYDESPQNEVIETALPGEDFDINSGNTTELFNSTNTGTDVLKWTLTSGELIASTYYNASQLTKHKVRNPDGEEVISYKDIHGRVLRHEVVVAGGSIVTYNVYNNRGSLIYKITPKVIGGFSGSLPYVIDANTIQEECYSYTYDERERLIEEKDPDKETSIFIYDKWDRLVMSQSGNQKAIDQWSYMKYDRYNRVIMAGLYDDTNQYSRQEMQDYVDSQYATEAVVRYEQYVGSGIQGYTNLSFPIITDEAKVLTVSYFDDYQFLTDDTEFTADYDFDNTTLGCSDTDQGMYCFEPEYNKMIRGSSTGYKKKVLGTNQWLVGVQYYDQYGRNIQSISKNHRGLIEKMSSVYSFAGWVLQTKNQFNAPDGNDYSVNRRFVYDHTGRLMEGYHQLFKNGVSQNDEVLLAKNKYNELGQLIEKNLHVTAEESLQSIDYRYDIRGWLKSINDPSLDIVSGVNEDDDHLDMFGMDFFYNEQLMGVPTN